MDHEFDFVREYNFFPEFDIVPEFLLGVRFISLDSYGSHIITRFIIL